MKYITKDSGKKVSFKSGMVRDVADDKPRFDLIWQPGLLRLAELYTRGAKKYGPRNWQRANSPEELERFKASAWRHFYDWVNDLNTEEDHASAVVFNLFAAEYVKAKQQNRPAL